MGGRRDVIIYFFSRAVRVQFICRLYCRRAEARFQSSLASSHKSSFRRFPPFCRRSLRYFGINKAWSNWRGTGRNGDHDAFELDTVCLLICLDCMESKKNIGFSEMF